MNKEQELIKEIEELNNKYGFVDNILAVIDLSVNQVDILMLQEKKAELLGIKEGKCIEREETLSHTSQIKDIARKEQMEEVIKIIDSSELRFKNFNSETEWKLELKSKLKEMIK